MNVGDMPVREVWSILLQTLLVGLAVWLVRRPLQLLVGALYWGPLALIDWLRAGRG